jgi:hypothetical protein
MRNLGGATIQVKQLVRFCTRVRPIRLIEFSFTRRF